MKKYIYITLFVASAFLTILASPIKADTCNNGQYGSTNCPPTDITIDKTVRNPITGVYVENLLSGDAAYSPNSEVIYRLKITNSSNQSFDLVKIDDILPVKAVSASVVDDQKSKVKNEKFSNNRLQFELSSKFEANSSIEIDIKIKLADNSKFNQNKTQYCGNQDGLQNTAEVRANDRFDDDSASICVKTGTVLPQSGVTDILPMLPFIGTGLAGLGLILKRKK